MRLFLLGFLVAAAVFPAHAQTRIAAQVNDDIISERDFEQRLSLLNITDKVDTDSAEIRSRLINQLIDEKLKRQEAARAEVSVSKAEVKQALKEALKQNGLDYDDVQKKMAVRGLAADVLEQQIESDLLGNVKLNLLLGDPSAGMIPVGGKISGSIYAGALGKAAEMIPQIEKMLPKLDSILANLNTLTADPAIAKSLHNVEHITNDLTTTTTQLNTLMASLNKEVPGMITRANNVLDQSGQLASNLSAVNVEETMAKVSETLENLRRFTDKLNANDGSLGLLLNDKKLYQNLNSTIAHADSLLINLREHPKRYVHFSVFGKKDK